MLMAYKAWSNKFAVIYRGIDDIRKVLEPLLQIVIGTTEIMQRNNNNNNSNDYNDSNDNNTKNSNNHNKNNIKYNKINIKNTQQHYKQKQQ